MSAWAETSVKKADAGYPPVEGEDCAGCGRVLRNGERVFRLTERRDDAWVCEACLSRPGAAAAAEGMGT